MNGKRVFDRSPHKLEPGEYTRWQADAGNWYACTPNGHVANLAAHSVVEHGDGSITVSPSIAVSTSVEGKAVIVWHGFLEQGVWRNA